MARDTSPAPPCLYHLNVKKYLLALKLLVYSVSSRYFTKYLSRLVELPV